ncbi:MAG: TIGR02300 family protein [Thermoanaerobaculia bacterium]|nr:TIGR02300 family protein [Thermoanaerobaculia bacterium]
MASSKLGAKHLCFHCGVKFYDFGKSDIICPSCGADQKSGKPPEEDPKVQVAEEDAKADASDSEEQMDGEETEGEEGDGEELDGEDEDFEGEEIEEIAEMDDDLEDYDAEDEVDDY